MTTEGDWFVLAVIVIAALVDAILFLTGNAP